MKLIQADGGGFFFFKRCQQNVKRNLCLRFLFDSVRPPRLQFKKMNLMLTIKVQGEVSHITLASFPYALRCAAPLLSTPTQEVFLFLITQLSGLLIGRLSSKVLISSIWHQPFQLLCPPKARERFRHCGASTFTPLVLVTSLLL